jgi:hypothetical protein
MDMLQELDEAIGRSFGELARKEGWSEIHAEDSARGALRDFRCGRFLVRVANDRRLLSVELGVFGEPSSFRDVSQYKNLLSPPERGRWHLSLTESADFLARNWDVLEKMLAPGSLQSTLRKIDTVSR